jgi:hypothetical protein
MGKSHGTLSFTDSSAAFREAKRRAVHGHYDQLVWQNDATGTWHTARLTAAAMEPAIADSRKVYVVSRIGVVCNYTPRLAGVLLNNLKMGY